MLPKFQRLQVLLTIAVYVYLINKMKVKDFGKKKRPYFSWEPFFIDYVLLIQKHQHGNTKKATVLFKIWLTLQFISLVIPPYGPDTSPWGHSVIGSMWIVLHGTVRLDSLFIDILRTPITFFCLLGIITLLFYLTAIACAKHVKALSEEEFMASIVHEQSKSFPLGVRVHLILIAAFDKVLTIPFVTGIFKLSSVFPELGSYSVPATVGLFLVSLLPIQIVGFLVMTPINWRTSYQALAYPHYSLVQAGFVYCASGVAVFIPLEINQLYHLIALMILGGGQAYFIWRCMPYCQLNVNYSKLVQGFVLLYGGLVLGLFYQVVPNANSSTSNYFAPLVYFFPMPALLLILWQLLYNKYTRISKPKIIDSIPSLELSLRRYLELDNDQEKMKKEIKQLIDDWVYKEESRSGIMCIWMAYFSLLTNDILMTQFYLGLLRNHAKGALLYIHKRILFKEATVTIFHTKIHSEARKFIELNQDVKLLLKRDCRSCHLAYYFVSELASIGAKYTVLVGKAKAMAESIAEVKAIYQKLIAKNKNNYELLRYYAGYAELTDCEANPQMYYAQAIKEENYIGKKFASKTNIVSFFDPKCCSFLVSCDIENFGIVIWQKNCNDLQFTDIEIIGSKFSFLAPNPFDNLHKLRIDHIKSFSLGVSTKAYGIQKSGEVIQVLCRQELINHDDGNLALLIGVRRLETKIKGLAIINRGDVVLAVRFS